MFCSKYRRLLIPYSECGLNERTRARVEAHLARCPSCAAELRVVQSVSAVLRQADTPTAEPAHDLWARVNERITSPAPAKTGPAWLGIAQAATVVAGVVLVAIVGLSMMRTSPPVEVARVREVRSPAPAKKKLAAPPVAKKAAKPAVPQKIEKAPAPRRPDSRTRWFAIAPKHHPRATVVAAVPNAVERVSEAGKDLRDKGAVVALGTELDSRETAARAAGLAYHDDLDASPTGDVITEGVPESTPEPAHVYAFADEELKAECVTSGLSGVATAGVGRESVVDILNKTEGVHVVALFSYP